MKQYIKFGPLGRRLPREQRAVLLIDEIDKADMEFPNDLLHEIDRMSFQVDETNEYHTAKHRPIVNHHLERREGAPRRLPAPLRLPLHRVPRQGADGGHRAGAHPDISDELLRQVLVRFYWLRELPDLRKRPSTSELIDWIAALRRGGIDSIRSRTSCRSSAC